MSTAAVSRLASEEGHITKQLVERYKRIAIGGPGAMVIEAAVVLRSRSSFNLRISDDSFVPELEQFVSELRTVNPDVKIGLQLIHFLKLSRSGWRQRVEDLKKEEIEEIPREFASGALRAKRAGFDFVEIHMAHFTTLASFLSLMNHRTDEYGGDFHGRVKLPMEVIRKTRDLVGEEYPFGMRMNGEEFIKEGNTLLQSCQIARCLAATGVDYISVSAGEKFEDAEPPSKDFPPFAGTGYSGYRMSPRWWHPDGPQIYLAEEIRRCIREAGYGIPIVTAGKIRTPELAEQILEGEKADIIGMIRALLCDPDWPIKAKKGRSDEIVKCASCGYCSEADERYEAVNCIQWPKGDLNAPIPWLLAPPCTIACPAGVDIRGYIELVTQGHYEKALELIEEKIPLPGVVGRVCPRFCEARCNRGAMDESIAINALKRYVADAVGSRGRRNVISPELTKQDPVAIVGSGPAGLSAAYYLARLGYRPTVFESSSTPGGMMAIGIPAYRLPREILKAEIDNIQRLGVEIKLNTPVGKQGLSLKEIREQGFKAIFLAVGAHKSGKLAIPNDETEGVVDGISWLKEINMGKGVRVAEKVVVIGGGNVAIDSARMALRLGAKEVSIVYRRSKEEMPALREEVEEAEKEGIKIRYLSSPCQIICEGNECRGIECFETKLGEFDEGNRRKPIRIENSEFLIDADMVISAIGETPDLSFIDLPDLDLGVNNSVKINSHTMMTNVEGIFAGGDVVTGPATVVEAIAAGRKAAIAIDKYLQGETPDYEAATPRTISIESIDTSKFKKRPRERMPSLPPKKRTRSFDEVQLGLSELQAGSEAGRCLQCGMFPKKE